jgi:hypothetical protein
MRAHVGQLAAKDESPKSLMRQSVECGTQAKAPVVLPSKSCAWPMLDFALAVAVQPDERLGRHATKSAAAATRQALDLSAAVAAAAVKKSKSCVWPVLDLAAARRHPGKKVPWSGAALKI